MRLILSQLFYTSFPGVGFKTLASPQVPREIRQAFTEQIVLQYWNAYNPPPKGYQAAYLHQVTPEHTLFGWLYNDGNDELGRNHVPFFVCYYLAQPLLDFELKNLFTCLQLGPLSLINRQNPPDTLSQLIIQDLNTYQSVRRGVAIPTSMQKQSLIALQQCELINLFIPEIDRHILQIDMRDLTPEHIATLSIYEKSISDTASVSVTNSSTDPSLLVIEKDRKMKTHQFKMALDWIEVFKPETAKDMFILLGFFISILAFLLGLCALIYTSVNSQNSPKTPTSIRRNVENAKSN
jgi:phosphate transport system substrate-binding protein